MRKAQTVTTQTRSVEQLRTMPYEEYLQTPEWLTRRKKALREAHYCCQHCHAENVQLNVYHRTYEHRGEELPSDLTVLCEPCHSTFQRQVVTSDDLEREPTSNKASSWLVGGGTAVVLIPILDFAMQWGVFGVILGGGAAAAVGYTWGPQIVRFLRRRGIAVPALPALPQLNSETWQHLTTPTYRLQEQASENIVTVVESQPIKQHSETPAILVSRHQGPDTRLILDLAENFLPDINMILKEGIFACGVKGSGKTSVLARIIEQIIKVAAKVVPQGIPLVIFDKEGDLMSLLEIFPNARVIDAEHWYTAEQIITGRLQVIMNLHAWLKSEDKAARIAKLAFDLIEYTNHLPIEQCISCPVFLDEGQFWLPQGSVSYMSQETRLELLDAFDVLLNAGRKRGLTPFIFTQRMAQINKDVCSIGIQIFMRQMLDNDHKRCMEYIRSGILTDKKDLADFGEGQGVVCLPKGVQLMVQFKERETTHISHTPTVDRMVTYPAQSTRTNAPTTSVHHTLLELYTSGTLSQEVCLAFLQSLPVEQKAPVLPDTHLQEEETTDRNSSEPQATHIPRHQEKYNRAITTWQELESKGCANLRDFAAAMNMGETKAYTLLNEMVRLNLIYWERKKKKVAP